MRVLITGATRGMGKAIAIELANKRYDLILISRSIKDLEELKSQIQFEENKILIIESDLSKLETLSNIYEKTSTQGRVDVIINNVGLFEQNNSDQIEIESLKSLLDVNLFSAIELTTQFLPVMKEFGFGTIINMGSIMSHLAAPFASNYSITKHAFKAWNDSLRDELRQYGIKVCGVYPGAVNTSSWDGIEVDRSAMIQVEDVAKLISTMLELSPTTLVDEIKLSPLQM